MPGSAGARCLSRRTATIIAPKHAALTRSALPVPMTAVSAPASAGPIARATLKATALSETACGSSSRATRSLTVAFWAGW